MISLTDEQIKEGLRERIKQLEEQIKACRIALKAFGENNITERQIDFFEGAQVGSIATAKGDRKTVRARVEGILADLQIPLTSREIMDKLNDVYDKKYEFKNFSGNFSESYRKKGSRIKKYTIEEMPSELKTVYGLKSWFNGDEMKSEYTQKYVDNHL